MTELEQLFKQICDAAKQACKELQENQQIQPYLAFLKQINTQQSIDVYYRGLTPAAFFASQGEVEVVNFLIAHFNISLIEVLSAFSRATYQNERMLCYRAREGIAILIRILDACSLEECRAKLDFQKNPVIYEAIFNKFKNYTPINRLECHAIIDDSVYYTYELKREKNAEKDQELKNLIARSRVIGGHKARNELCTCEHCNKRATLYSIRSYVDLAIVNENEFTPLHKEYIRYFILGLFLQRRPEHAITYLNEFDNSNKTIANEVRMFYYQILKVNYKMYGYPVELNGLLEKIASLEKKMLNLDNKELNNDEKELSKSNEDTTNRTIFNFPQTQKNAVAFFKPGRRIVEPTGDHAQNNRENQNGNQMQAINP